MFTRSLHTGSIPRRVLFAALFTSFSLSLMAADGSRAADANQSQDQAIGAVLALTNLPGGNAVVMYHRAADGSLTAGGLYPTGGAGTGAGLNSQNAIVVTDDRRFVLASTPGATPFHRSAFDRIGSSSSTRCRQAVRCPRASRPGMVSCSC